MNTKTALLDSAERLARTRGFDAFSYADLSKLVGIRKASIHHHFPTKADLGLSLISRYRETFFDALGTITTEHTTAGAQLQAYLALYRSALGKGTQVCLCVSFSAGRDSFDEAVLAELNRFHDDSVIWLTDLFQRGRTDGTVSGVADAEQEARACLALVEGAQLVSRAAEDAGFFDRAVAGLKARAG